MSKLPGLSFTCSFLPFSVYWTDHVRCPIMHCCGTWAGLWAVERVKGPGRWPEPHYEMGHHDNMANHLIWTEIKSCLLQSLLCLSFRLLITWSIKWISVLVGKIFFSSAGRTNWWCSVIGCSSQLFLIPFTKNDSLLLLVLSQQVSMMSVWKRLTFPSPHLWINFSNID